MSSARRFLITFWSLLFAIGVLIQTIFTFQRGRQARESDAVTGSRSHRERAALTVRMREANVANALRNCCDLSPKLTLSVRESEARVISVIRNVLPKTVSAGERARHRQTASKTARSILMLVAFATAMVFCVMIHGTAPRGVERDVAE
jgi:hypothetical protein